MRKTEFEYLTETETDKRKYYLEIAYQLKRLADATELSNNISSSLLTEHRRANELKENQLGNANN